MTTDQLLAELEAMLAARRERNMGDFKVVSVDTLKSIYRDLDACQRVIWLTGDFDPAYCTDAKARLKEIDELLDSPAVQGEPVVFVSARALGDHEQIGMHATRQPNAVQDMALYTAPQPTPNAPTPTFQLGDHVRKTKGSQWEGRVVGTYSTSLTPEGYAVESDTEKGSVQIYPVGALELVGDTPW